MLAIVGVAGTGVRSRRMILVDTSGTPLTGVNVVVRRIVNACCERRRRTALAKLQVTLAGPALAIVRVTVHTLSAVARDPRRPGIVIPS